MRKPVKKKWGTVLSFIGIGLISLSVLLVIVTQAVVSASQKRAGQIVESMYSLMPEIRRAAYDDRVNITMSSLEIGGENFCGIMDVPAYQCTLPVGSTWKNGRNTSKYPCRYTGSLYDNTLILGGTDNQGQLDFMKLISLSDYVYFIDTTGARYTYVVTDIENTGDVTTENLYSKEADLVFFSGNTYSMDYTVVRCKRYVGGADVSKM